MTPVIITKADFRHATTRVCDRARDKFFRRFGLDWDRFCREGMTATELRGPGQHLDLIDRLEAAAQARVSMKVPANG
jgi:hypothetical protein